TFGTQALSDHALVALKDRKACLLGQHGQIALGRTLQEALWLATEVETLSRIYVQALTLGDPPVLLDEEMERVIAQMRRMSYGFSPDEDGVNDVARPRGA
ncbi:MAG: class II aldolase/adducin family protein, partial [Oricola sp.]